MAEQQVRLAVVRVVVVVLLVVVVEQAAEATSDHALQEHQTRRRSELHQSVLLATSILSSEVFQVADLGQIMIQ